jgi:hypothetical protein
MKMHNLCFSDDLRLLNSLSEIKRAQAKLNNLISAPLTATALESRIELCEILLCSISDIQSSLAANLLGARRQSMARLPTTSLASRVSF